MKKLCLGTLLRILCDARIPTLKQYLFLNDLLSTVKSDPSYIDSKAQSALLSGKNNLTHYDDILTCDKDRLKDKFENNIKPYFNEDSQKLIIICIQDVLKEDTAIKETDESYHGEKVAFGTLVQLMLENASEEDLAEVYSFCVSVGLPVTLEDLGISEIKEDEIMKIGRASCRERV